MKAIIHIGMIKTGSTSIQKLLKLNCGALENEGVRSNVGAFPAEGIPKRGLKQVIKSLVKYEISANEKAASAIEKMKYSAGLEKSMNYKLLSDFLAKLSIESGIFINSDEGISRFSETQMIALDKYLSQFFENITYVIYIRNTVDFFVSLYSEELIYGSYGDSFSEFLYHRPRDRLSGSSQSQESAFWKLHVWDKVLGDRLNVRLLVPDWLVNGDLIDDFAFFSGIPVFERPSKQNESFAAEYVEWIRQFNRERSSLPMKTRMEIYRILKKASSGKSKLAASGQQAKLIEEIYGEHEEKIRGRFFPDRPHLYFPKLYGRGVEPAILTESRKAEIEFEIRQQLKPEKWGILNNVPTKG